MIKYAEDIVKEINNRNTVKNPNNCVTGEEFEKWLYEEKQKMKSIDICGINHKINEVDDWFDFDTHFGQINYSKAEILLNKDLPDDLKNQTLIHEILHGIFTLTGYENLSQDETLIKTLSCELNRIFEVKGDYKIIEHDGCAGCKHLSKTSQEDPCVKCKQNYIDKYERVK